MRIVPSKAKLLTSMTAVFILVFFLQSLSIAQVGSFNAADDVTKTFESYRLNPSYNYYYSGPDSHPIALMGLSNKIKLEPDLWKPVKATQQKFKDLVAGMQSKLRPYNMSPWGFAILDDRGRRIGIWYSIPEATTIIRMKDKRTAEVYTPPIDTYLELERER